MNLLDKLILCEKDLKKIHNTSIDILKNIGVKLYHDGLIEYLSNFDDIRIDYKNRIVRFSPNIVEDSIKKGGKKFKVYGRDKNKSADFGYDKVVTTSSWGMAFKMDVIKNEKVLSSTKDIIEAVTIGDYLKYVDIVGVMFRANGIPGYYRDIYEFGEAIKRTTKPIGVWVTNGDTFEYIIEIYNLFIKEKNKIKEFPPFFYEFEPITPLVFHKDGVDILYKCAKLNIPVCSGPIPQPMSTGPVTIAGCLALGNAEQLASLVFTQLINPGNPFMCGLQCNVTDPFSLVATMTGAPENILFTVTQIQLAKHYDFTIFLDNQISCSNQLDYQMGVEFGMNTMISLVLGAEFHGHAGIVGADQGASLLKLILDEEAVSYMKRISKLYEIGKDTLAYDVIKKVGIGGNFLAESHTLKYMRSEYWTPKIFNRDSYTVWKEKGAKSLIDKALDLKNNILKDYKVEYVERDIEKEIDSIVDSAKKNLNK